MNKKDVGDVYHSLHYPSAEFYFNTSKDLREIIKKVACNIHYSPASQTAELENSRKTRKSKYHESETLFSLQKKIQISIINTRFCKLLRFFTDVK